MIPRSLAWFSSLLWGAACLGQEPLQRFEAEFRAGYAALAEAPGSRRAFKAARDAWRRAAAVIPALPEERRARATFGVDVSLAELQLRLHLLDGGAESLGRARLRALAAREAARGSGAWQGVYRARALVLLWQVLPSTRFDKLVDAEERAWIEDPIRFEREAKGVFWAWRALVADLAGDIGAWHDLVAEMVALGGAEDVGWREIGLQRLFAFYFLLRDYHRARVYLEQLPLDRTRLPRAMLALELGDPETAVRLGRGAVPADPRAWQVVGDGQEQLGRYRLALDAYRRARASLETPTDVAANWNGMGDCHLALREWTEAEAAYGAAEAALADEASTVAVLTLRVEAWKDRGRLASARERWRDALGWFERSLADQELLRAKMPPSLFGASTLAAHPDQLTAVDGVLQCGAMLDTDPWERLAATERAKARSLFDALHGPADQDVGALRSAILELVRADRPVEQRSSERALERQRALLEARLARVDGPAPLDGGELREWLGQKDRTLVLSYWIGRDTAWLMWTVGGSEPQWVRLGDRDTAVRCAREAFTVVASPASDPWPALDRAAGFFLPRSVSLPEVDAVDRVLVCPDAEIHTMPFAALRRDGVPLGSVWAVERAPSFSVLAALERRRAATGPAITVDSVPLPTVAAELDPLVWSEREGAAVRAAWSGRRLRGGRATLGELARLGAPPQVCHISTHTVEHPFVPTRSLLLLADGPVSAASLARIDLDGSHVVLSACASGARVRAREGVVGLTHGVFEAGARSAVSSLWPVNQQATADLMAQYHHWLAMGESPGEAMRRARASLLEAPQYSHPHFWAGFAVVGGGPGAAPAGLDLRLLGWALAGLGVGIAVWGVRRSLATK